MRFWIFQRQSNKKLAIQISSSFHVADQGQSWSFSWAELAAFFSTPQKPIKDTRADNSNIFLCPIVKYFLFTKMWCLAVISRQFLIKTEVTLVALMRWQYKLQYLISHLRFKHSIIIASEKEHTRKLNCSILNTILSLIFRYSWHLFTQNNSN